MTPEGLINFSKRRQVADVIQQIQQLQLDTYCFADVPFLQVRPLYLMN